MRLLLRNHIRTIALVAITAVASSACVKQHLPGVGLVKFDSSAVFGQSKGQGDIPGFGTPGAFSDQFAVPNLPIPQLIRRLVDRAPSGPCPEARLSDFPSTSASVTIKGLPRQLDKVR